MSLRSRKSLAVLAVVASLSLPFSSVEAQEGDPLDPPQDAEAPTGAEVDQFPITTTTLPPNPLLEDVRSRRARSVDELADARLTDVELADKIEEIEERINEKEEELSKVRGELEEKEDELGKVEKRIKKLDGEIAALEKVVRSRAVALYMGQAAESSQVAVLLSSENPTEFEMRRMLVQTANSSDEEVKGMLADKKDRVEQERDTARAQRDDVKTLEESLEQEVAEMEEEKELVDYLSVILEERVSVIRNEVDLLAQEEKALRALLGYPEDPALDVPTSVERPESSRGLIWPVDGVLTSVFGMRWGALHAGIDVGAPAGTPVYATKDGTVIFSGVQGGYGNIVIIDHGDGFSTSHAHLSRTVAVQGSRVLQGELVGLVGSTGDSTGPHLHFETRVRGVPYDPLQYLPDR